MNEHPNIAIGHSTCPHDCPSCCALDVELVGGGKIGRVRGSKDNSYTDGVICAKVARYAERIHHPDRLTRALKRKGAKGEGEWQELAISDALDEVAEAFDRAEQAHGSETVWPYHYAGTMGLLQRDGIHRLRHAKRYSGQFDTICTNMAWTGFIAGTGKLAGSDPREMARSDLVVIWGTNAVSTQVNVMTHAVKARKTRGARIVVVDVYRTATMEQADLGLCLRPGTDGALAASVMHVLFRDGYADRDYLASHTDRPADLEAHLKDRTPDWAARITGLGAGEIETFAKWVGETPRSFFRLGYGFTRSRNGAFNMHCALSIPAVTGAWKHEGGGAFHNNGGIYGLDTSMIAGLDMRDPSVRMLDQSRIGAVLTGEPADLKGGPPVTALMVQNTNPANVAPEQDRVIDGLMRDDLFVMVHEQFMTETAALADIVLPATMFMEHDDVYRGGGHQHVMFGPKLIDPPGDCQTNHAIFKALAGRLGASHPGFEMSERDHIDWMLKRSDHGTLQDLIDNKWIDCQPEFDTAHYINGFAWPDGKFRFSPDWGSVVAPNRPSDGLLGPWREIPEFPDFWDVIEAPSDTFPLRLVTAPAHGFLNSTFAETDGSRRREDQPWLLIHRIDASRSGFDDGDLVQIRNARGATRIRLRVTDRAKPGTVIAEGIWPNHAHVGGRGINCLTAADPVAPFGGAAFHDNRVAIEAVDQPDGG